MSKPTQSMRLSHQELLVCQRLVEAYPAVLPLDTIVERQAYTDTGGPGDAAERPTTQVCRIRALLGRDAVETVWQTRLMPDGSVVRLRNRPCLGYRAGVGLVSRMVEMGLPMPVSPGSSETHPIASATCVATVARKSHSRRTWQASEPHRCVGLTVQAQLEASCRRAVGL